ncbi:MAG: hypothetical protein ACREQY_05675 [Candidatus Binatia bacterium]
MRPTRSLLPLLLAIAACSRLPFVERAAAPAEPARDIARTVPKEGEDEPTQVFDEKTRQAALAKRFPGSRAVDLVRVLQWTEERTGACWTESRPPWKIEIDATYEVDGKKHAAASLEDLKKQGWLGLYRTPNGSGFERRASFDGIDLAVATDYACRCIANASGKPAETKLPIRLRMRWQGKGKMPELSASTVRNGKKEGLKVAFAPGHLMTYEFPVTGSFPGGRPGKCGGTIAVSLLSEPPMQ